MVSIWILLAGGPAGDRGKTGKERQSHNLLLLLNVMGSSLEEFLGKADRGSATPAVLGYRHNRSMCLREQISEGLPGGGLFFLSDVLLTDGSRDDPLIAPGQRQTCSSATTDTSTAAKIVSIGCCWEGNAKKAVTPPGAGPALFPFGRPFLFQSFSC